MSIIFLLIPLSILFAVCFLGAFVWAVRSGQYEDTCTPSMRVLLGEATESKNGRSDSPDRGNSPPGEIAKEVVVHPGPAALSLNSSNSNQKSNP